MRPFETEADAREWVEHNAHGHCTVLVRFHRVEFHYAEHELGFMARERGLHRPW